MSLLFAKFTSVFLLDLQFIIRYQSQGSSHNPQSFCPGSGRIVHFTFCGGIHVPCREVSQLGFGFCPFPICHCLRTQTSLEILLLFLVFAFRCCFDALVAGSSCRSINKMGSFVNSYVDTTLYVWIWTRQTIFLKRQIHYVFALLAGVTVLGTSARRQHNLIPSLYFAVARSKGWKNNSI